MRPNSASICQHTNCADNHFVISFIWVNSQNVIPSTVASIVYHALRFDPFPLWAAMDPVCVAFTKHLGPSQAFFLSLYVPNV